MPSRAKSKPSKLEELPLSLSSDDGMTAELVQKIHVNMEKKKKEKEARHLAAYKKATDDTNSRAEIEFNDYCDQIDQVFEEFAVAYAKVEDEIRAIWLKIVKAHGPFLAAVKEQFANEIHQEKEREDQHVLGIAYHKKSLESLEDIIDALLEDQHGLAS